MPGETTATELLNGWRAFACAGALMMAAFAGSAALLGQETTDRDPVVAKAAAYVRDYTKSMASVVCDERQTQKVVKHDGKVSKQRELVSEVLLVDTGGNHAFSLVVFRDVLSVDGKPVGNRDTRVRDLLMKPRQKAFDQAVRITNEGARHNIGAFAGKKGNVDPLVQAIWWFGGDLANGKYTRTADGVSFSRGSRRTPNSRGGSQEIAVRGRYAIDGNGRVSETLWTTDDPTIEFRTIVRYRAHPKLEVLVPAEMELHERQIHKPNTDSSDALATYTNCRQFQVTVEESVQLPKP